MRRISAIAFIGLSLAALAGTIGEAGSQDAPEPPERPESFAFAIGSGNLAGGPEEVAARLGGYDLVVVDGEEATPGEIRALRLAGAEVLGYLSVGTIERWRSWYPRLRRYRLGAWADWKDEWFADVSRAAFRRELTERIAPRLLGKGFGGLFLDNVDMVEQARHRSERDGMRALVSSLSTRVRASEGMLFAQNGAEIMERIGVLELLDGWNREDVTSTFDFDRRAYERTPGAERRAALAELRRVGASGALTTATDYTRRSQGRIARAAVANACAAGALPYVSDIGLTAGGAPHEPIVCPPERP